MNPAKPHLRLLRAGIAFAAALLAMSAHGYEARFVDGLSAQEKAATGIAKLTAAQAASLDVLVSHDATLAQQGGVTGFSSGFLARHSDAERSAAGIDRLSDKEKSILDILVARTIALGPPPDQPFTYSPPQAKVTPPPAPPAPSEVTVSAPRHMEVHGDVSFTVGAGGHGSNFYGTSMDFNVTDPSGKFTLGVGFDDYHGKGLLPLYPPYGPYGLYGPYSAYGPIGPGYVGPPYWGP
jgi:hypothetical protein